MGKKATKVMLIGIDAPIAPRLVRWARQGKLPAIASMLQRGVFAPNCLVPFPTITPPNWVSIATGAWPGTHGITDFDGHVPGDDLNRTHQNFDGREVKAEPLWRAIERASKRAIVVNYPTSWNTGMENGYLIGGYGIQVNSWCDTAPRTSTSAPGSFILCALADSVLISTESYPFATEVSFRPASGWKDVEHGPKALEAEARLVIRRPKNALTPITWHVLIDQSEGKGYDTALVARSKDRAGIYACLRVGEWSANVCDTFHTEVGERRAAFKFKLLELAPDGSAFKLFMPGLCDLNGWAVPAGLERELVSEQGLPTPMSPYDVWLIEWIDNQTLVETADLHNMWLADVSTSLMKNKPWDAFFIHIHTPDSAYHRFLMDLDPLTTKDPALPAALEEVDLALNQSVDRCIGRLLEQADDDTLVVLTSDHGAKAKTADFHVEDVLLKADLLAYQSEGDHQVDWGRTKAIGQRYVHIYVNTKGRDPQGIVESGDEYERAREEVIKALHEYVDPKTGLKPIVLALKREDARILGLYGDKVGNIIFAIDPRFGKEHGDVLPTARYGIGDLRGLFVMAGPGVRQGEVIERTVWLTDIVPTICHLAELPVPRHCEGAIVYQALEDPDAQVKELQALRRNVERLKRMVERPPMC